jgi:single-strand DNA-binding protein
MAIARYTLAIDRKGKRVEGQPTADFISCVAFGRNGEFAEKFLKQGIKIAVCGRIQTGSYTNKEGQKVYTTEIVVEEHDFCEKKQDSDQDAPTSDDGFMKIPEGIEDNLPFK